MRAYILVFVFSIAASFAGQCQSGWTKNQSFWWEDMVEDIVASNIIVFSEGLLELQLNEGEEWVVWNASGVVQKEGKVRESGSIQVKTDYLLNGRYYVGVISSGEPLIKAFDKEVFALR